MSLNFILLLIKNRHLYRFLIFLLISLIKILTYFYAEKEGKDKCIGENKDLDNHPTNTRKKVYHNLNNNSINQEIGKNIKIKVKNSNIFIQNLHIHNSSDFSAKQNSKDDNDDQTAE